MISDRDIDFLIERFGGDAGNFAGKEILLSKDEIVKVVCNELFLFKLQRAGNESRTRDLLITNQPVENPVSSR